MITQEEISFPLKNPVFHEMQEKLLAAAREQDWECAGCGNKEALNRLPDRYKAEGGKVVICPKCGGRQTI